MACEYCFGKPGRIKKPEKSTRLTSSNWSPLKKCLEKPGRARRLQKTNVRKQRQEEASDDIFGKHGGTRWLQNVHAETKPSLDNARVCVQHFR